MKGKSSSGKSRDVPGRQLSINDGGYAIISEDFDSGARSGGVTTQISPTPDLGPKRSTGITEIGYRNEMSSVLR